MGQKGQVALRRIPNSITPLQTRVAMISHYRTTPNLAETLQPQALRSFTRVWSDEIVSLHVVQGKVP